MAHFEQLLDVKLESVLLGFRNSRKKKPTTTTTKTTTKIIIILKLNS